MIRKPSCLELKPWERVVGHRLYISANPQNVPHLLGHGLGNRTRFAPVHFHPNFHIIHRVPLIDIDGKLGYLGLDVYEEEADVFFQDLSNEVIQDDTLARLLTFPNVVITGHQAFFTHEALQNIADTTMANISQFEQGQGCKNEVTPEPIH